MQKRKVVLLILDGFGLAPPGPGNAISQANLKSITKYMLSYPHSELAASGEAVGLPAGEDGNTETGHINIGAGRTVWQDLPRINMAIQDRTFFTNDAFVGAIKFAILHKTNLHLMGLVSDAGVHSNIKHLYALLELVKKFGAEAPSTYIHVITDGRDSPPNAGIRFVKELSDMCAQIGVGKVATVMGRYYAMDRDKRWERIQAAYEALTENIDKKASSAHAAIEQAYVEGTTDEFIKPVIITDTEGNPLPRIVDYDAIIFYNFRIDRPRQLTKAFVLPNFESHMSGSFDPYTIKYSHKHVETDDTRQHPFTRKKVLTNIFFVSMTEYERNLPTIVAYPPNIVQSPLGKVVSEAGMRQLRMSETEKERFVTYYFNGMREESYPGEDHIIVPSPKVATYDMAPEMSAKELTEKLLDRMKIGVYSLIIVNLANPDMVAHTGNIPAAIKACQVADECVGRVVEQALAQEMTCIITADHGNVEEMLSPSGEMDTEHSTFPVPFIMIDPAYTNYPLRLPLGKLGDIAPTILSLMNIPIPPVMTGKNLLQDVLNVHT